LIFFQLYVLPFFFFSGTTARVHIPRRVIFFLLLPPPPDHQLNLIFFPPPPSLPSRKLSPLIFPSCNANLSPATFVNCFFPGRRCFFPPPRPTQLPPQGPDFLTVISKTFRFLHPKFKPFPPPRGMGHQTPLFSTG